LISAGDIIWHDALILKTDLIGRPVSLSIQDQNGLYEVSFLGVEKVEIDTSNDWGPSSQILSFEYNKDKVTIQMQNGFILAFSGNLKLETK
jgi:hypothetical protein